MQTTEQPTALTSSPDLYGSTARRRLICLLLLAITIPAGLAWRFAPLHLPQFAFKYGGSMLWAMGVYWLIAILLPRKRPLFVAACAALVSVAIELFKLVRDPALDQFRRTLAGKVLIGRYFTFGAIAAYLLAIVLVALADARLRPGYSR